MKDQMQNFKKEEPPLQDEPQNRFLRKLFAHSLSEEPQIRAAAYRAMGNFKPEDSTISCLLNGLTDEHPSVRQAAGASLIRFGYQMQIS